MKCGMWNADMKLSSVEPGGKLDGAIIKDTTARIGYRLNTNLNSNNSEFGNEIGTSIVSKHNGLIAAVDMVLSNLDNAKTIMATMADYGNNKYSNSKLMQSEEDKNMLLEKARLKRERKAIRRNK